MYKVMHTTNTTNKIQVGTILVSCMHFNMYHKFYKVVEITSKTCFIIPIRTHKQYNKNGEDGICKPIANQNGRGFRRKLNDSNYIAISSLETAFIWNGEPKYFTDRSDD